MNELSAQVFFLNTTKKPDAELFLFPHVLLSLQCGGGREVLTDLCILLNLSDLAR